MKFVSPFVATIILVIITISIGIGVYMYLSSVTKTTTTEEVINCLGGDFKIINFYYPKYEFKYSREIIIDNTQNSNNLNDYQILVTIDTSYLISNNYLKNDCSDIRFLDSDKNTLLNYWIEGPCNSQNTKIWVKVNIPANSKKIIYFVSGNENLNSLSNGDLVFDFFDDFEGTSLNTSKWSVEYSDLSFSVSNSILYVDLRNTNDNLATTLKANLLFNLDDTNVKNYIFEAYVKVNGIPNSDTSWILSGMAVGKGSDGKGWDYNFILGWEGYYDRFALHRWIGSMQSVQIPNVISNEWYLYRLYILSNNRATGCIGNNCVNVNWDIGTGNTGNYYLRIGGQGSYSEYWYDWVRVRKYTSPEPTISLGNELGSIVIKSNTYSFNLYFIGNPQSSLGSKYIAYITLKNNTVIKKDIDIYPCNLGSECISSPTIKIETDSEIKKIEICSKACSYVCSKYIVS